MLFGMALNENNDIYAQDGQIKRISGGAMTTQHVRSRLLTYKEEWFLDLFAGVPWFQEILKKPVNLTLAETRIKEAIIRTDGIETLTDFSLTFDKGTRKLSVAFAATTSDGTAINSTLNLPLIGV